MGAWRGSRRGSQWRVGSQTASHPHTHQSTQEHLRAPKNTPHPTLPAHLVSAQPRCKALAPCPHHCTEVRHLGRVTAGAVNPGVTNLTYRR